MLKEYLKLIRVSQWIKNLFVFVPLLFSQHLFDESYFLTTLGGFVVFCLTSSVVYILNDIIDIEADRAHPAKKFRPLPAGTISKNSAIIFAIMIAIVIGIVLFFFNLSFVLIIAGYFTLNIFYSSIFKNIVLLDVFSIAAGFMLRVIGGAFVISVEISSWLILTTMFISLYLGVMKRRSELMHTADVNSTSSRKVLVQYSPTFTEQMATVAASGVIICYALYTVSARTVAVFGTENLIYTTPFVVFGIFRYMYIVYMNEKGENTSQIMITDIPMIVTVLLYILTTVLIIYKIF